MLNRSSFVALAGNGKRLCDGGFYAQRIFKTAIAKPVLYDVVFLVAGNLACKAKINTEKLWK